MRRVFIILTMLLSYVTITKAQDTVRVSDYFDGDKFKWAEDYGKRKNYSVELKGGKLVLTSKKKGYRALTYCDFPIRYRIDDDNIIDDFILKIVFTTPEVNEKDYFGIIYNVEDNENFDVFLVKEKKAIITRYKDGRLIEKIPQQIVLKKGKKKNVALKMEKKGNNLIFSNDGMEITKSKNIKITNTTFGILRENKGELTVESIQIEQLNISQ